jgi:hypothetical protein
LKKLIGLFIVILPLTCYFLFNPIYTGDISKNGKKVKTNFQFSNKKKLVILVLPDCPYCHESIVISKKLIERNPKIEIEYWVIGDMKDSKIEQLRSAKISVIQNDDIENAIYLSKGIFPTYVLTNHREIEKRWTNNEFGVIALDEIEQFFK